MNDIHNSFAQQGLIRPRDGRVFAGVCAGLGRRFGLDPWPARLLFVLVLMVIPGSQILIYPILWILMPAEESLYPSYPAYQGYPTQPPAQGAPGYQGYPTQPPAQAAAPQAEPQPPVEEPAASQQGDTA
jgi:phage shock protein PspC (stress-responsive transcriptional regulator)